MPPPPTRLCLLAAFGAAAVSGCHSGPASRTASAAPVERVVVAHSAGASVITLVRPTSGVVRLSLWLDAGSRDASPAQIATLAAWLAAEHAGRGVTATVYPDATELVLPCERSALAACMTMLQRALATRAPTEVEVQDARVRLQGGRRQALARDPERDADTLALHALLGPGAEGFFPLGSAADDPKADASAVGSFLRDHYGPTRALVIAAGDAEPKLVQALVAGALTGAPQAARGRSERALSAAKAPSVEVKVLDRNVLALAIAAADVPSAEAPVEALRLAIAAENRAIAVHGHVFSVRGGALALLHLSGRDPESMLLTAATELGRLQAEPGPARPKSPPSDDLQTLSRLAAMAWASEGPRAPLPMHFAAGVLVDGGRADSPRSKDPDAAEQKRRSESLALALDTALGRAHPGVRGTSDDHAARVVLDNGARIDVLRTGGERVAIAVRSGFGAGQDPALLHGRAALLATLTATACAGLGPERLRAELGTLGASLEARTTSDSYGLSLDAPASRWRAAIELALRCMRTPSRDPVHFASAALRLQGRLGGKRSAAKLRAEVAAIVAPRAPGLAAPWGSPDRLGNLTLRSLTDVMPLTAAGARWSVAVAGPVPVQEAVERIARRVAQLPAGSVAQAQAAGEVATELRTQAPPLTSSSEGSDVLLLWQARGAGRSEVAARVLAAALEARLLRIASSTALWHDGAAETWGAWSAVAMHLPAEALGNLEALTQDAASQLDHRALDEALQLAVAAASKSLAEAGSRVSVRADRLVEERLHATAPDLSLPAAQAVVQALTHAMPSWVALD